MQFSYKVTNLFNGILPSQFAEREAFFKLQDEQRTQLICQARGGINDFEHHIQLLVDDMKVKTAKQLNEKAIVFFNSLDYPFNKAVIVNLRKEIEMNSSQLAEETSFFYYITVGSPIDTKVKMANCIYEHIFILEQFYCADQPRFRFYQSMINHQTLCDTTTEESWDLNRLNIFMDKFMHTYCVEHSNKTFLECFGFPQNATLPPLLSFEDNHLVGVNISYTVMEFDPKNCMVNLRLFDQLK